MKVPYYHVDAFTDTLFGGNPAAVCILRTVLSDGLCLQIAAESNVSETAFVLPPEGKTARTARRYSLRWFSPATEVPLCGHATLATAKVLFEDVGVSRGELVFDTLSGELRALRDGGRVLLDFPSNPPEKAAYPDALAGVLSINSVRGVLYDRNTRYLLVHAGDRGEVEAAVPDFVALGSLDFSRPVIGIILTCGGDGRYDFYSRFFTPWLGINEDPVTGSSHTVLFPYWSGLLGKKEMTAFQLSRRGGVLYLARKDANRVFIGGDAVVFFKGELTV
jgi:PhzF family phenazine biosynthesis protein